MFDAAARGGWRRGAFWLLPLGALILATNAAKARPLALPVIWSAPLILSSVGIALLAWLLVVRPGRLERIVIAVALVGAVAVLVVAAGPIAEQIWLGPSQLHPDPGILAVVGTAVAAALGLWLGRLRRTVPGPLDALIGIVLVSFVLSDFALTHSEFQRDFGIYLDAGRHFLAGEPVYLREPLHVAPADLTLLPFLYPPVVLPLFAAISVLPPIVASVGWLALQIPASILAIRFVGVSWRWSLLLLLWPPFVQGIWVGNVAIWMALIFALVPLRPSLVGLPALFKIQSGLIGIWLIRERRWRSLVAAAAVVTGLVVATLPLVGIGLWREWVHGLFAFQDTLARIPALRGIPISRAIGEAAALALTGLFVIEAFRLRSGRSLGALGEASVAASPTLYMHGLTLALPGFLSLRAGLFWLALLVATTAGLFQYLWLVLVVSLVAPFVPALVHAPDAADAAWQPLGSREGPWAQEAVPAGSAAEAPAEPKRVAGKDGFEPQVS